MTHTLTSVLLAVLGAPALGQPDAKAPASPPPAFHVVSRVAPDKGEVQYQMTENIPVTEKRTVAETVNQNGKEVVVNREVTVTVMRQVTREILWSAKGSKAVDGAGKAIAAEALFKRVKAGDVILRAAGDAVDPAWLKVLKPEAVILLTPAFPAAPVPKQP